MPTAYECISGPKIKMNYRGGSAVMVFKLQADDVPAFFAELFPPNPRAGYTQAAWVPGYSWLKATEAVAESFDDELPLGVTATGEAADEVAKVTVQYESPEEDEGELPADAGGDGTGPGGEDGASGGETGTDEEPVVYLRHSISIGGEFLTLPNRALAWDFGDDGLADVSESVSAGMVIPMTQHQVEFLRVKNPPWDNFQKLVGRVNRDSFCGAPPGTMLFLGVEGDRERDSKGEKRWDFKLKFSQKDADPPNGRGWNHFLHPTTGRWELLRTKKDGLPIYKAGDFRALFNAGRDPFA